MWSGPAVGLWMRVRACVTTSALREWGYSSEEKKCRGLGRGSGGPALKARESPSIVERETFPRLLSTVDLSLFFALFAGRTGWEGGARGVETPVAR